MNSAQIVYIWIFVFIVSPVYSQHFQFPEKIEYHIFKNNVKTTEQSIFTYTKKGRYIGTISTAFKFINPKKKQVNEIHTYLRSLDYAYKSSIVLRNSKKINEMSIVHGKGFDLSDTMMIKFQTDKRSGFEPLCQPLLFLDINTALVFSAHASFLNKSYRGKCYFYSFTDSKLKLARMGLYGKKSIQHNGKEMVCKLFQLHSEQDSEVIDILIFNDANGFYIPASIAWKNLHIRFQINKFIL